MNKNAANCVEAVLNKKFQSFSVHWSVNMIIQTLTLCGECWGFYCFSAISVFILQFPQAFWGHGSLSLRDQVNHGEVTEAEPRRAPSAWDPGKSLLQVMESFHTAASLFGVYQKLYWWDHSWTCTGISKALRVSKVFCKQPHLIYVAVWLSDICWLLTALKSFS